MSINVESRAPLCPNRETSLAYSPAVADDFANGTLRKSFLKRVSFIGHRGVAVLFTIARQKITSLCQPPSKRFNGS